MAGGGGGEVEGKVRGTPRLALLYLVYCVGGGGGGGGEKKREGGGGGGGGGQITLLQIRLHYPVKNERSLM